MKYFSGMFLAVVLGLSVTTVTAADWSSDLRGGGVVTVDPDTQPCHGNQGWSYIPALERSPPHG